MFDPIGFLVIGIVVLIFHFYLKLNMKYFDSLVGSKTHEEQISLKINQNKKLSFREKISKVNSNIIKLLITISWYIGLILIILGITIKLFSQIIN